MAVTSKVLFRGAAATSSTTLYTVPSSTTTVVTNIAVANGSATAGTFTLLLNDIDLHFQTPIDSNSTVYIDLKQVLATTETIKGLASATTIDFHISGVEIV
jgi:polyisoprenoid-binding protein YceI